MKLEVLESFVTTVFKPVLLIYLLIFLPKGIKTGECESNIINEQQI